MMWEFLSPGWVKPPASAVEAKKDVVRTEVEGTDSSFEWIRWQIPELLLSHQAAMLLTQGMKIQDLFEHAVLTYGQLGFLGPYLLVKGEYRSYVTPPKVRGVVLAVLGILPSSISREAAIGAIVQATLAN